MLNYQRVGDGEFPHRFSHGKHVEHFEKTMEKDGKICKVIEHDMGKTPWENNGKMPEANGAFDRNIICD